ncbi:MAG: hypothetical protein QM778_33740 [Myxococcales bacterium]
MLLLLITAAACTDNERGDSWQGVCIDQDGDGFGVECANGPDCNDHDANLAAECSCTLPATGCACEPNAKPIDCVVSREHTGSGSLVCRTGLMYCQDQVWTECVGTRSFEVPAPSVVLSELGAAKIQQDAAPRICDVCQPDCYRVDDPLTRTDAGVPNSTDTVYGPGGGITLPSVKNDAGVKDPDVVVPDPPCVPGNVTDKDCDGIPDKLDPYPDSIPFNSDHSTIFMDLAPGESDSATFEVKFYLNTADIYFLIDQTGSMAEEQKALFDSLKNGNYLDDPATTADESVGVECADRNFDGKPDATLKTQGIAGNIACLIRSSGLGLGWYREVPYSQPDDYGIKYSYPNFEAFEHRQDISEDESLTLKALDLLYTRGNQNWAESAGIALHAVASGGPIYMGWDRPGIPAKICPAGRVGYPCFRSEAVPVVILITDAPMMNGPPTTAGNLGTETSTYNNKQPYNYQPVGLAHTNFSSDKQYHLVDQTNETYINAYDVGTIDNSFKTYSGDTRGMVADLRSDNLGMKCSLWPTDSTSAASPGLPDAVFKFKVETNKLLTVSTRGTRFKPVLAIVPVPTSTSADPPPVTSISASSNNYLAPKDLGTVTEAINIQVNGNSTSLTQSLPVAAAPACFAGSVPSNNASSAYYKFTATKSVNDVLFTASGSDFDAMLGLYAGAPVALESYPITGNTNDYFYMFNVPSTNSPTGNSALNGRMVWLSGGDTSATAIRPDFPATGFYNVDNSDTSCNSATGSADDAVIDFSLAAKTTIRVETTSSTDSNAAAAFDNIIALIERPATLSPIITDVAGNDNSSLAYTIQSTSVPPKTDEGSWAEYHGYTANYNTANSPVTMKADDVSATAMYDSSVAATSTCSTISGKTGYHDVVYKFNVTQEDDYDIDTLGSGFTTFLALHNRVPSAARTVASNNTLASASAGQDTGITFDGTVSKLTVTGSTSTSPTTSYSPDKVQVVGDVNGCQTANKTSPSLVYKFVVTGATRSFAFNRSTSWTGVVSLFSNPLPANSGAQGLWCRTATDFSVDLAPGTYYVMIHGKTTTDKGTFTLNITDSSVQSGLLACDMGSHPNARGKNSLLRRHLTVGTYYIVVKGNSTDLASSRYVMSIRRTQPPPVIACNWKGVGTNRSAVTRTLDPGNYSVIVRGRADGDVGGKYGVLITDVSATPLACHNEAGLSINGVPTASKAFRANLVAGTTYYMVLRGNNINKGSGDGPHTIVMSSGVGSSTCAYDNTTYSATGDTSFSLGAAEITQTFTPGEYYAVLKGKGDTGAPPTADKGRGWYQFSVGDPTLIVPEQTNTLPTWTLPGGGIKGELTANNIRVITVASVIKDGAVCNGGSCSSGSTDQNKALTDQGDELARATGALSLDSKPLRFNIKNDGTGMGYAVVQAVNQLAKNIAMDVSVRFVPDPQKPTPPQQFKFTARAINVPGDLCDGPVDTDGDKILDTHLKCAPGAVPRFEVTFTNPPVSSGQNVKANPADPKGGYNMRIELIGDAKYVVDKIPVYIIPEDVVPNPPPVIYQPTGTYYQDVSSSGCVGTERPDWQALFWNASLPAGTSIEWRVCGGNTVADLNTCASSGNWQLAARVDSGGTCQDSVECPNGYCDTAGICEYPRGPACTAKSDCGVNGNCIANQCIWTANPIDLNPAVMNGFNGLSKMRVQVRLNANGDRSKAPAITDFRLNYVCAPGE